MSGRLARLTELIEQLVKHHRSRNKGERHDGICVDCERLDEALELARSLRPTLFSVLNTEEDDQC